MRRVVSFLFFPELKTLLVEEENYESNVGDAMSCFIIVIGCG